MIAFPKKNEAEENTKSSLGSTLKSNINNLSKSKNNLPPTIGVGFNPNHSKIISSHEAYLESLEYSINQEKDRFKNIVISQGIYNIVLISCLDAQTTYSCKFKTEYII